MNEQELSYGIFLSESQLDFLYNYPQGYNRMKCFVTFLKLAVKEPTHYVKGKFEVDLTPGQFAISEVELAKLLDCNRKTAGKMAVLFHNAGLVTSVSNSFTTIFTIPCLACWYQGDRQFMSKVYSRHHVPSERIPIARKNNKSENVENVQDPDIANQNDSVVQPSTSNDCFKSRQLPIAMPIRNRRQHFQMNPYLMTHTYARRMTKPNVLNPHLLLTERAIVKSSLLLIMTCSLLIPQFWKHNQQGPTIPLAPTLTRLMILAQMLKTHAFLMFL